MATGEVTLAGLGARDTLRLEAGLPLWGHELGRDHYPDHGRAEDSPCQRKRREAADFPGADVILDEFARMGQSGSLVGLLASWRTAGSRWHYPVA